MKLCLAVLLLLLSFSITACSGKPADSSSLSSGERISAGTSVDESRADGEERNPGCSLKLKYPLKLSGVSNAVDFSKWTAADLEGNPVDQEILKGSKLTLVSAWSTYCGSSMNDLELLQKLYGEFGRDELNVVGILASAQNEDGSISEEEMAISAQMIEVAGAAFLQLLPSDDLIAIKLKDIGKTPETFLLDRAGNLVGETYHGSLTEDEYRELIQTGMEIVEGRS